MNRLPGPVRDVLALVSFLAGAGLALWGLYNLGIGAWLLLAGAGLAFLGVRLGVREDRDTGNEPTMEVRARRPGE